MICQVPPFLVDENIQNSPADRMVYQTEIGCCEIRSNYSQITNLIRFTIFLLRRKKDTIDHMNDTIGGHDIGDDNF